MTDDAPLTDTQQRLMAYIDNELTPDDRRNFERELAENPDLAIEAAAYQNLCDLTNSMHLMEPADHEMRRFWAKFYNRGEWQLGWLLIVVGSSVLFGFGVWSLLQLDVSWVIKAAAIAVVIGGMLLLTSTIRFKLRTHQFDRYRGVLR